MYEELRRRVYRISSTCGAARSKEMDRDWVQGRIDDTSIVSNVMNASFLQLISLVAGDCVEMESMNNSI